MYNASFAFFSLFIVNRCNTDVGFISIPVYRTSLAATFTLYVYKFKIINKYGAGNATMYLDL